MSRKHWGLLVAAVVLFGAWRIASCASDASDAASLAVNRPWIERRPQNQRDVVGHILLLDHPRGRVGVTGKSSAWRHDLELFRWALEGERLLLQFPQSGNKEQRTVRVWRCAGEAPKPFDLCLELTTSKGRERYFSREDWRIEPRSAGEELAQLRASEPDLAFLPPDPGLDAPAE